MRPRKPVPRKKTRSSLDDGRYFKKENCNVNYRQCECIQAVIIYNYTGRFGNKWSGHKKTENTRQLLFAEKKKPKSNTKTLIVFYIAYLQVKVRLM